jgi:hypothetical protein
VPVVAQVGRDEAVVGCGRLGDQIGGEGAEVDHARLALRVVVDDRVEVHERVVPRGVLVARLGLLGVVGGVEGRVAAGRAHILHVALPRQALGLELVGDGQGCGRIDATRPDELTVEGRRHTDELRVVDAVGLGLGVGRLAAHHGDVVAETQVARAVVLLHEQALSHQLLGQVRRGGVGTERLVVILVLHHDDEDVLDAGDGRGRRCG